MRAILKVQKMAINGKNDIHFYVVSKILNILAVPYSGKFTPKKKFTPLRGNKTHRKWGA